MEKQLPEALAEAFARQATRALEQGLLHGYVETEDSLSVLRGRMRVGDQIARHHGRLIPLEVRFDEFTVDIAENQLLLATTLRLLRLPIAAGPRRALQRIRLLLSDVTPLRRGQVLPAMATDAAQPSAPASVTTGRGSPCRELLRAPRWRSPRVRVHVRHVAHL